MLRPGLGALETASYPAYRQLKEDIATCPNAQLLPTGFCPARVKQVAGAICTSLFLVVLYSFYYDYYLGLKRLQQAK